ncbi:hypothetical protein [Chryseobacterium sp.]|uniref:hypothetical protein n=1 Tax=Chryseobacterium sp. TaxID=1871047 RepID=UPI00321A6FE4
MKKLLIVIFGILYFNNLYSQCVGCNMLFYTINFSIYDIDNKENTDNVKLISENDTIYVSKNYKITISKIKHDNLLKTIFLNKWNTRLKDDKTIQIEYSSAFNDGCSNSSVDCLTVENDILIKVEKNDQKMNIFLYLYDGKIGVNRNKVNLSIPFCEGTYKITDTENLKLIKIKDY